MTYDLKFFTPILRALQAHNNVEVRTDEWSSLHADNGDTTLGVIDWADVVIAEWCGPAAALASRRIRPDQRLLIRLHRFELHEGYCDDVKIDAVDTVVTVDEHYRRLLLDRTGWPEEKVRCIPNTVDADRFALTKTENARFGIGLLGASSKRKRLDEALRVIRSVRRHDDRFTLRVKSAMPQDLKWVWDDPEERSYFERILPVYQELLDEGAVIHSPEGPDVPEWLRGIGFVLSVSDDESFHLSPAEGMASGAVPVIRYWPGAETVYDKRWIHATAEGAAASILSESATAESWDSATRDAQMEVRQYSPSVVLPEWVALVVTDQPSAGR
ncbi:MAG: hypothetical protein U9R51_05030 [Actinomycetota bacterium]|nr:hypothetical protein [Actinomycetota bacterium]